MFQLLGDALQPRLPEICTLTIISDLCSYFPVTLKLLNTPESSRQAPPSTLEWGFAHTHAHARTHTPASTHQGIHMDTQAAEQNIQKYVLGNPSVLQRDPSECSRSPSAGRPCWWLVAAAFLCFLTRKGRRESANADPWLAFAVHYCHQAELFRGVLLQATSPLSTWRRSC